MSEQAALDKKAIRKEILALIIPIILESIFVYLAGIVSASLVGHLSGLAVATQGLANRITGLLNVVWGAVRIGSMVYYVNLIGEGKYGELKQGFKNICTVTLGIAIGFVLILFLFPSQILSFFTEDVELIASAKSYLHITLLALPLWVMTKMNSAMFNAMGDTKTPMYLQVLINVVNIAIRISAYFHPEMGFLRCCHSHGSFPDRRRRRWNYSFKPQGIFQTGRKDGMGDFR